MGLSFLRLIFRSLSKLDVGLDNIARNVSWYGRPPLPGESDVMAATYPFRSGFNHGKKSSHTESTQDLQGHAPAGGECCTCAHE